MKPVPIPDYIRTKEVRRATRQVTAVVPLHGVDAELWLEQLLTEFTRLDWNVAWHFNNISKGLRSRAADHPRTVAYSYTTRDDVPYTDLDRTWATRLAAKAGSPWVCPHDADETLEPRAPELLARMLTDRSVHIVRWYNVWRVDPDGSLWIRVDKPLLGHKTRFYPTGMGQLYFRKAVSSMYMDPWPPGDPCWDDLRILHWGFSTPELRERHARQWQGTKTTGKVDSDYWQKVTDPEWLARVRLKKFDPNETHTQFCRGAE